MCVGRMETITKIGYSLEPTKGPAHIDARKPNVKHLNHKCSPFSSFSCTIFMPMNNATC